MSDLKLEVLLKHYEVLANYNAVAQPEIRNRILSFSLLFLGVLFAGCVSLLAYEQYLYAIYIFYLAPILITCFFLIWIGEIDRMVRVGLYIKILENKINSEIEEEVLCWEDYIRKRNNRIIYPNIATVFLFLGVSFFSPFIAYFIAINTDLHNIFTNILFYLFIVYHFVLSLIIWFKIIPKLLSGYE